MTYTEEQEDTLVVLNVVPSIFSFLGASFIIANYYLFEDLRSFAFKLVLFVAIGDVINSVGNFLGGPERGALCDIQGFVTQFGDLVSFGWVTAIAWTVYTIYTSKTTPTIEDANRWYKRMHIIIWVGTAILSFLPITTGSYGPSGGLCWIEGEVGDTTSEVWRWLCFYLPLWGALGYMGFVYCKVWNEIKPSSSRRDAKEPKGTTMNANGPSSDSIPNDLQIQKVKTQSSDAPENEVNQHPSSSQIMDDAGAGSSENHLGHQNSSGNVNGAGGGSRGGGALQRIKYYPLVLFCCYFFATIRRLDELFTGNEAPFALAALQVFFSALLGTCNAMVYGLSPMIRKRDMEYLRACFGGNSAEYDPNGSTQQLTSKAHLTDHDGNAIKHNRTESEDVELGGTGGQNVDDAQNVR